MLCCGVSFLLSGRGALLFPSYGFKAETCRSCAFESRHFLQAPLAFDTPPPARARLSADHATRFRPVSNILISLNDETQNGAARVGFANCFA